MRAAIGKMICCDTSFLFSLYGNDGRTAQAQETVRSLAEPLRISPFNEFELLNAIRLATFRKLWRAAEVAAIQAAFEADVANGLLLKVNCNLAAVITEAMRLSSTYSALRGHRAFDILHVSAALVMNSETFLSFDENQRVLAAHAGLRLVQ